MARGATALVAALALGFGSGSALYVTALMLTVASVVTTFITLSFKNLFDHPPFGDALQALTE